MGFGDFIGYALRLILPRRDGFFISNSLRNNSSGKFAVTLRSRQSYVYSRGGYDYYSFLNYYNVANVGFRMMRLVELTPDQRLNGILVIEDLVVKVNRATHSYDIYWNARIQDCFIATQENEDYLEELRKLTGIKFPLSTAEILHFSARPQFKRELYNKLPKD